jgi:hypothetical protein
MPPERKAMTLRRLSAVVLVGPVLLRRAIGPKKFRGGENVMGFTLQHKRALFWGLGILTGLALANVAWAQIANAIGRCLSPF